VVSVVTLVLVLFFANQHGTGSDLVGNLGIVVVVLIGGVVSWLVTRWQVADGVLRIAKVSPTPEDYPRRDGVPSRNPIS